MVEGLGVIRLGFADSICRNDLNQYVGMVVTRFNGEKIAEEWTVSELAGQLLSKSPYA